MPEPRVRIVNSTGIGHQTKVYIDGVDVSSCFNNVTVSSPLRDVVTATLDIPVAEVEFAGVTNLVIPNDDARDLLIQYGWTPPVESVTKICTRIGYDHDPLERELFGYGEPVSGRDLVNQMCERVATDWEPNDGDTLTVARVYDEEGELVPGKRSYTLTLTMDTTHDPADDAVEVPVS